MILLDGLPFLGIATQSNHIPQPNPLMSKAIHIQSFPATEVASLLDHLRLVEIPIPEPKQGEVLVNIYLRPVNPTDVFMTLGAWGTDFATPRVPGSEGDLSAPQGSTATLEAMRHVTAMLQNPLESSLIC